MPLDLRIEDMPYEVGSSEKVRTLEKELALELDGLKNELEENEMVLGIKRAVSSVALPKDISHFRMERQLTAFRALQVCEAKPLVIQADVMKRELQNAYSSDHTPDSLPLLLHQYFVDRMHQLVQCKHLHLLRWKRFCEHTSTIEALYPYYQKRIAHIMAEYNDSIARAQRLAIARESFLAGDTNALLAVKNEDILIYLRWLVCHLHAIKTFNQYMRVIQWLPVKHKKEFIAKQKNNTEEETVITVRIPTKYQDDPPSSTFLTQPKTSAGSRPGSGVKSSRSPPPAPSVNPVLMTTNPLPASGAAFAAAAAGGGMACDEATLRLPVHTTDVPALQPHVAFLAHLYGISTNVDDLSTTGKEMELYSQVNRLFRKTFTKQEHLKTFKTYDHLEIGQEHWGADSSMHSLKQESNWVPFITLKAECDPHQTRKMVELRSRNNIDELLRAKSKFIQLGDAERILDTLKHHAADIRGPRGSKPPPTDTPKTARNIQAMWKKIYTNPDLYHKIEDVDEGAGGDDDSKGSRKRKNSFDYIDTMQLLGLDEGEQEDDDPASVQGAYLSYLQLRHLRIRDLQRTCVSVVNYFRSLERTLTINDEGLSHEGNTLKRTSAQNHRKSKIDGGMGGGGGLGSHAYLHNTPSDFKLSELEFMQFAEVENHDDFYTIDEGRIHVQDHRGYYTMYDTALNDFKELEHDLLLIATHYLEKDHELRNAWGAPRTESARLRQQQQSIGDLNLGSYGHKAIDRFGVILDLWTNEAAFLEAKKELLDCYVECYHHVFDRDERRLLTQVITNLMHRRPRFDFNADYFIQNYRLECIILRLQAQLVRDILDKQIESQREYIQKVCRDGDSDFGLPHKVIPKQLVSVNMTRSALKNIYMLEFHPSLSLASRIPEVLKHAYWEIHNMHRPETITEQLQLEKTLMEVAHKDWSRMEPLGASYSAQVQKDLFSDVFAEDPLFITEIAQTLIFQTEQESLRKSQKEKHAAVLEVAGNLMQALSVRHYLMDCSWECEILSKLYKKQAVEMGYDECHLFMRYVQFEFAALKETIKPPPLFITSIQEDDTSVDRYIPNHLSLAIHELDESHVGRFSFRSRDGLLQMLKGTGVKSLETVLACQVVHKNALLSSVNQANECQPAKEHIMDAPKSGGGTATETKSEKSSTTATTAISLATQSTALQVKHQRSRGANNAPEAFVSVQLEKIPSRDVMLNAFVQKKIAMGTVLKNPDEMEKLKKKKVPTATLR